jgi:periplasmic copper chaperone A
MPRRPILAAVCGAALLLAPAAFAHVELSPDRAAAGSTTRLTVTVPSELPNAATVGLTMKLPTGLRVVAVAKHGWKLVRHGAIVSWSGGSIAAGRTDHFTLRAQLPRRVGAVLRFPALQTYSNGDVVHWIGPANADEPAPTVVVTAARSRR